MFIGHYAVGFACKRFVPKTSLGTLFMAALWLDLLWPALLLLGVERMRIIPGITKIVPFDFEYYPYSHSLLAVSLWAIGFGVAYFALRRLRRASVVLGLAVLSHWFLDALVHRPDLPVSLQGQYRVGLGLWNSVPGTLAVEGMLFLTGFVLYFRATYAYDRIGRYGAWVLAGLLAALYAGQFGGAVPPGETVVAYTSLSQWVFILLAFWVDRHRRARIQSWSAPLRRE